jgi:hypothetical protein
MVNGKQLQCQYRRRNDRHDQSMRRGVRHTCVFEKNTGPLDRTVHALAAQEAGEICDATAQFVGQSNIAIWAVASPEFRSVIQGAFARGFDRN